MKILVTGGDGFLAKNIKKSLGTKYYIDNPTSKELDLLNVDLVEFYLTKINYDVVIHAANYDVTSKISVKDPALVVENNLKMFFNLIKFKKSFGKFLMLGSGAEYNRLHWTLNMLEGYFGKYIPSDPYGFSKYIISSYIIQHGAPFYVLRLFSIFGKYENWINRFISNSLCRVLYKLPIRVSNPDIVLDYLYINDFILILDWFISNTPKFSDYNICSGIPRRLDRMAKHITLIAGGDISIEQSEIIYRYSGNNLRLLREFPFHRTNLRENLRELYEWYKLRIDKINPEFLTL